MPLNDYAPVIAVGVAGAIGYGELRARVARVCRDVETKASKEIVETQYGEILRRLDRIEDAAIVAAAAAENGDRRHRPARET